MQPLDDVLHTAAATAVKVLNDEHIEIGGWVPQVNLYYKSQLCFNTLVNGFAGDPIAALESFGRGVRHRRNLEMVVVLAETVNDAIMVSIADRLGRQGVICIGSEEYQWRITEAHSIEEAAGLPSDRVPAQAVWRGIKSPRRWYSPGRWL